ncbi:MAG: universal stress protein [Magnetococcus sp. YQC-3]
MDDTDVPDTNPFNVVLLATDGSEFSAGVERVGIEMAAKHHSRLFILRLLLSTPGTDAFIVEEQEAALSLERVVAQCAAHGVSCLPMVRPTDEPSHGILSAAEEVGAQLVILGRRGKRGLAKFMVGDATAKVLDKAGCSVLVVPRLFSFWNSGVLLVVEPTTAEGDVAASAAFNVAKIAQLPLTILAVSEDDEEECRESNQVVNRLVAMAKLQKISAEGLVQPGDKVDVILEVARQRSTDIIVSEPYDRSVIDRLFNVNKLVRAIGKAHCPVLVARPSPAVAS